MTSKNKTILKKILAYVLMSFVLILTYAVTMFIIDMIFGWFGGEDGVSWISTAAGCIAATAGIIIADIINSRKKKEDRSDKIIKICRQILWTTTIMFCGMMLIEWLIQRLSDKDFALGTVHWLSFSFACAIFDQFYQKFMEKKIQEDENVLVLAAECEDIQTAEVICNKLESNGVKAMIVVIGALTVSLFTFLKVTKYYEISINVNESTIALFDERVELLRTCGPYSADPAFIDIDYVAYPERAKEIMDYFQLDTLYDAAASTWDKALAIGKFVAFNIPHDNQKEYPEYVNAIGLWEYTKDVAPAFNCRLHSIMTFELLHAAGIKARFITCLPQDKNDQDCHVVNEVWLPETQQWAMLDTDMGGRYVTDLDGNLLSIRQMREKYISGDKMLFYHGFENGSSKMDHYYAYMAKNTYWFCCWGALGFYQEDYNSLPESTLRNRYYALVPEGFEPFHNRNYTVTHDPDRFWK